MEAQEIIEGARLILDSGFAQPADIGHYNAFKEIRSEIPIEEFLIEMKYHTSFDWLMPAVKRAYYDMDAMEYSGDVYSELSEAILSCNIQELYTATLSSIQFINENK